MPKPSTPEKCKYMFTDDIKFLQKALVFHPENDGLFLALKRSLDSFSRPNDWDLPGGNVLFGELHEESLRREIKEESNLEVGDFSPIQIITDYDEKKSIYYIFANYFCQAKNDKVEISGEHTEFRWVDKDGFMALKPASFLVDFVEAAFEGL